MASANQVRELEPLGNGSLYKMAANVSCMIARFTETRRYPLYDFENPLA